jgi:hypothetical protein
VRCQGNNFEGAKASSGESRRICTFFYKKEEEEFVLVDNCMAPIGQQELPSRTMKKMVLLIRIFLAKKPCRFISM